MKQSACNNKNAPWLKWCAWLGVLLCLALGAVLFFRHSMVPRITIVNRSGQLLEAVAISGNGFRHVIPRLQPGEKQSFRVKVRGESGLTLECQARARRVFVENLGYIESSGGYRAVLIINEKLEVRCLGSVH